MKYFIVLDNEQKGPFSLEEIANMSITQQTLVWHENLDDWTEAKNITDFKEILKIKPPPIPKNKIEEKPVKVVLTKEKSNKKKADFSKILQSLLKLLPYSFIFGVLIYFISAFTVYEINKFDNHDWSKVSYDGEIGYNFPLDDYSPDFYSNFCGKEKIIQCLKANVKARKEEIAEMSFKNGLVGMIVGYFVIVLFHFTSRKKSTKNT